MKPEHWNTPEGYEVSSYCAECGRDFSNDNLFDRHRTGVFEYTYYEGLKFDSPVEDGRRCKTVEEMVEDGMRPMTDEEMGATQRHRHRIGYGVEMWFDPVRMEKARNELSQING